ERFSDGGVLDIRTTLGSIVDNAAIDMGGANQAAGGDVTLQAARDLTIGAVLDVSGGASDGGALDLLAGDNIRITKNVSVESRLRGGGGRRPAVRCGARRPRGRRPRRGG